MQWSSFDRASEKGPGDAFAWYANDDRGKYVRVEERLGGKEFVMVETAGPGCIARIWSANPSGTLHFDIDGRRVWSVDFALLCSGKVEGVPEPLAGMRSKGGNCHLPIPFGRSLKVSATAGDLYYHVDVMQFAVDVPVLFVGSPRKFEEPMLVTPHPLDAVYEDLASQLDDVDFSDAPERALTVSHSETGSEVFANEMPCLPAERALAACTDGVIQVRAEDGLHFCPVDPDEFHCPVYAAGGKRFGEAIATALVGAVI